MKSKRGLLIKILLLVVFLQLGCRKSNKNKLLKKLSDNSSSVRVLLPKEVNVNDEYYGNIVYRSKFDSIILGENDARAITFYASAKGKELKNSFEELKKTRLDTFVRVNDSIIFVNDIFFKKEGQYFIEGYIIDEILLNREGNKDAILTTIEVRIVHPIYVKKDTD